MTYQFDSFRLDTVAGKHNDIGGPCDLEGARFGDPENTMVGPLNSYGCLFNTSVLFTLTNHYRIGFAAGVDVKGMAAAWKGIGIDLLLRQRLVYAEPKEYAEECKLLGGQLIVPSTMTRAFGTDAENSSRIICSATVDSASAGR